MIARSILLSSRANASDLTNYSAIMLVREILRSGPDWRCPRGLG
jgi:hypothetical protein